MQRKSRFYYEALLSLLRITYINKSKYLKHILFIQQNYLQKRKGVEKGGESTI